MQYEHTGLYSNKLFRAGILLIGSASLTVAAAYGVVLMLAGFGLPAHAQTLSPDPFQTSTTTGSTAGTGTTNVIYTTTAATSTSWPGTTTTLPGIPNTGAGGTTGENIAILISSALAALAGLLYLCRPTEEHSRWRS